MDKRLGRRRRAGKSRGRLRKLEKIRLVVHRTPRHIYAQVISAGGDRVLVTASTLEQDLREQATGNCTAAAQVGKRIATRTLEAGIAEVAFDRSGFKYHGRVKALAEAAREGGLKF